MRHSFNAMAPIDKKYHGIFYMLLAALGFSMMGGAARLLKGSFNAGQLVFYRNLVGLFVLQAAFAVKPPVSSGGKLKWLIFRGIMGTVALYTYRWALP
jgi:drug/metabolite transporter (DMT)-like permease